MVFFNQTKCTYQRNRTPQGGKCAAPLRLHACISACLFPEPFPSVGCVENVTDSRSGCRTEWLPSTQPTRATMLLWMSPAALIRAFRDWASSQRCWGWQLWMKEEGVGREGGRRARSSGQSVKGMVVRPWGRGAVHTCKVFGNLAKWTRCLCICVLG